MALSLPVDLAGVGVLLISLGGRGFLVDAL